MPTNSEIFLRGLYMYWWFPVRLNVERMRFFVFPVEYVLEAHSSCKVIKVLQDLASNLIIICCGCSVGMNLSPFVTRFTWSLVSSILESFLICFLLASKVSCFCSSRLKILRSLPFFFFFLLHLDCL